MADDKPRSALAEKALAQKAAREADKAKAADTAAKRLGRQQTAEARWGEIGHDLRGTVETVNTELADTGTALALTWVPPEKDMPQLLSTATVAVSRDGRASKTQILRMRGHRTGQAKVTNTVTRTEDYVPFEDIDATWLTRTVRSFVDKALD